MKRTALVLVAAAGFALTASGQTLQIQHETLAKSPWSHNGTSTEWMDDVPDNTAEFGVVDRLVSTKDMRLSRTPLLLDPGWYVATVRFKKFKDANFAAPLTFEAKVATGTGSIVIPVTKQTVDSFIHSHGLVFNVGGTAKLPVVFSLSNSDQTVTKADYDFDSFSLGRIDIGKVHYLESITRRWGRTWGAPHVTRHFKTTESPFGVADRIENSNGANLWWANWFSPWYDNTVFRPGTYTANVRLKKEVSSTYTQDWDFWVTFDINGNKTNSPKLNLSRADQPVGEWVLTPNLVFFVRDPRTLLQFHLQNIRSNRKADYLIDSFIVRRGGFETYEAGCRLSSLRIARLRGGPPQLGEIFEMLADPTPNPGAAVFWIGTGKVKIDLTSAGAPGCFVYTLPVMLLAAAAQNGVATLQIPFPSDQSLLGLQFENQALIPDPGANQLRAATTNGGTATVGN